MVDQTSLDPPWSPPQGNGKGTSAAAGVRDGVGDLVHDIVSLAELQAELLGLDARESVEKAKSPLVMLAVGGVLALGAVPVLLLALGEALHSFADWDRSLAYLVSGLVGTVIGGVLVWAASRKAGDVIGVFMRSRVELAENIRWIKYAVTRGRRPPR